MLQFQELKQRFPFAGAKALAAASAADSPAASASISDALSNGASSTHRGVHTLTPKQVCLVLGLAGIPPHMTAAQCREQQRLVISASR